MLAGHRTEPSPEPTPNVDPRILDLVVCPRDQLRLEPGEGSLVCANGHEYAVLGGLPILLVSDSTPTHAEATFSLNAARLHEMPEYGVTPTGLTVDPWVNEAIAATNGMLYLPVQGKLTEYPIPAIRLPRGHGQLLLEIGCNWGRWCIAAAQAGYRPVGIDPSLNGVLAARRVTQQLGIDACFAVADGRYLPFRTGTFDQVFSYSVLQHLSKPDVCEILKDVARVLRPGGRSLIQMANMFGVRCLYHQGRRGFRSTHGFEVRYWSPGELKETFTRLIGPSGLSIDGFFSLDPQLSDLRFLPPSYKAIVYASEILRRVGTAVPALKMVADSLYVESVRN
jgi:SAM-dependent methyltransferase